MMNCKYKCANAAACKFKDDCFHYDDLQYELPVPIELADDTLSSDPADGIVRVGPGASFWYD